MVIICGGASPFGPVIDQNCGGCGGGGDGGMTMGVTDLFDLDFALDIDVHVDMTSALGGDKRASALLFLVLNSSLTPVVCLSGTA